MRKKLLSLLLAVGMIVTMVPMMASAEETPHFSAEVVKGDDGVITVTLSTTALTDVTSITGGIKFDTNKLVCTDVLNSYGDSVTVDKNVYLDPTVGRFPITTDNVSLPSEANKNGRVGFAFTRTDEGSFKAGEIFTATFTAKEGATGNTEIAVYESTGGTGGYSAGGSKDVETKTVDVTPEAEPTNANLALVENGGTAFANSEKNSGKKVYLNDGTNARWQPSETASGTDVYAGILWEEAKTIDKLIFMWRDTKYAPAIDGTDYLIQYSNNTTNGEDGDWVSVGNVEKVRVGGGVYTTIIGDRLTYDANFNDATQARCAIDTVSFEPITVKAIRIKTKIPETNNQIQLFEMEVYAPASFAIQKEYESEAASGAAGLVDRLEVTTVDKATFGEKDIVKADYTITRGDKTETGTRYITSSWKGIQMTLNGVPEEITPASIGGAKGEYITGIIFRNLKETDVVEVTYSIVAAPEE